MGNTQPSPQSPPPEIYISAPQYDEEPIWAKVYIDKDTNQHDQEMQFPIELKTQPQQSQR